jgi:tRNA pseudouridine synthase 10
MNQILQIAGSNEAKLLCARCLGRLFAKLGYRLDNPTRGKALRLLLHINNQLAQFKIDKENEALVSQETYTSVEELMEKFDFEDDYMKVICSVLGCNYPLPIQNENSLEPQHKKNLESSQKNAVITDPKLLEKQILSITDPKFLADLAKENTSCEVCNGVFDEIPKFVELVCETLRDYEFNDFLIGCKLDFESVAKEEDLWARLGTIHPEPMKGEFNRELGKLIEAKLGKAVNFDTPDITVLVDTRYDNISLQIGSAFIYGRYRKLVRDIPQTKWPCKRCWGKGCENCNGTGKIYHTSVEELVADKVMESTKAKTHLFHGMGREDIGVKMLGNGRPFILEVTEPVVRNIDLTKLEKDINEFTKDKVEVSDLRFSTNQEVRQLKAAKPSKTYKIKINFEKSLKKEKLKDIVSTFCGKIIKQRTPVRVSHRRADLVRERKVLDIALSRLSKNGIVAELEITGESGLYIKELIHGDTGRTSPSLAEKLDVDCKVQELDVISINDN